MGNLDRVTASKEQSEGLPSGLILETALTTMLHSLFMLCSIPLL